MLTLRDKLIGSPFDLAVMLVSTLKNAHYVFANGGERCALIWDVDDFDCLTEVNHPNVLLILSAEDYRGYRNLSPSDWITNTLPRLTDILWSSHFSQKSYCTSNYTYMSKLVWSSRELCRKLLSIFPENELHTAMLSLNSYVVPILFSSQVDVLLEEPFRRMYQVLKRGDYTWVDVSWSGSEVQISDALESLNEDSPFLDEDENHIAFHGGDGPEEFPLIFAMTEDHWVEHVLERDRNRHERFFFERGDILEANSNRYRSACLNSKLLKSRAATSFFDCSLDITSDLSIN